MKGVRIEVVGWDEAEARVMPVRTGVFVVEQGVPEEIERDAFDAVCRHAIAHDAEGRVIATGRLLPDGHYERDGSDGPSAQRALMQRYRGA